MAEAKTATRTTLTQEWRERQKQVDWMHAPLMPEYVNQLVAGQDLHAGGHWALYARDKHLRPLAERRAARGVPGAADGLSMLSLACGSGHVDEYLITALDWPISRFVGLEYDSKLLAAARQKFADVSRCRSEFHFFDFNRLTEDFGPFDVVFTCHSIHHCTDLENLLVFINRSLRRDGMMVGIDFFGPTRFQIEPEAMSILEELFAILPPHLRRNLASKDGVIEEVLERPTIEEVRRADPSESVRSSDLRTLLFSSFPVLDMKPMGGTLLRWLLQNRAGNFDPDNSSDLCIIQLLQILERKLIENREIRSDDLFFVLGKSDRV